MLTLDFQQKTVVLRVAVLAALLGLVMSGAVAQQKERKPSLREDNGAATTHRVETGNRSERSSAESYKPSAPSANTTGTSSSSGRSYTEPTASKPRKPVQERTYTEQSDRNTDYRQSPSGTGNTKPVKPRVDSYDRKPADSSRTGEINVTVREGTRKIQKPDLNVNRVDTNRNRDSRVDNNAAISHNKVVTGRDYRDRAPGHYYDDRYRPYRPRFDNGRYYYPARPHINSIFGYWGFNNAPGFSRSMYYYYGYPYIDRVRIHVLPYVSVAFYGDSIRYYDDDYYLRNGIDSGLDYALNDIRRSWLDDRLDLLENHVQDRAYIAVLLDGRYDYSVEAWDYMQMTSDAIENTRSVSFNWQTVRQRSNGDYTAFGKHNYRNSQGRMKTVYVSYTLSRIRGEWFITEVGSSDRRLG